MLRNPRVLGAAVLAGTLLLAATTQRSEACTGIRLIADDGSVVPARTLEFAIDIKSAVAMVPRGYPRSGTTPDGKEGLKWNAKYASVGMNGLSMPFLFDGFNEKGLAAGCSISRPRPATCPTQLAKPAKPLRSGNSGPGFLENFATIDEVKANIAKIVVPAVVYGGWGFAPEAHYVVHDADGNSIVIEYVGGKLNVHDNPLGVVTNSPAFDWHMTNLRNYVNFAMTSAPPVQLGTCETAADRTGVGHAWPAW